jgi:hypothetical protein
VAARTDQIRRLKSALHCGSPSFLSGTKGRKRRQGFAAAPGPRLFEARPLRRGPRQVNSSTTRFLQHFAPQDARFRPKPPVMFQSARSRCQKPHAVSRPRDVAVAIRGGPVILP